MAEPTPECQHDELITHGQSSPMDDDSLYYHIPRERKLPSWVRVLCQRSVLDADRLLHPGDRSADVTQCLVDIVRGALLFRKEIVDKSHRHGL